MKKLLGIVVLSLFWNSIAYSFNEEKYTGDGGYKIKSTNKEFVKISEQDKLTYKNPINFPWRD